MITPPKRHMHRESAVQDFVNGLLGGKQVRGANRRTVAWLMCSGRQQAVQRVAELAQKAGI